MTTATTMEAEETVEEVPVLEIVMEAVVLEVEIMAEPTITMILAADTMTMTPRKKVKQKKSNTAFWIAQQRKQWKIIKNTWRRWNSLWELVLESLLMQQNM